MLTQNIPKERTEQQKFLVITIPSPAPPRLRPFAFPADLPLGARAHVTCMAAHGDLPLTFAWQVPLLLHRHVRLPFLLNLCSHLTLSLQLDGAPLPADLPNTKNTVDDFSSHLSISSLAAAHDGTYTCTVSNTGGSVEASSPLVVNIPPR